MLFFLALFSMSFAGIYFLFRKKLLSLLMLELSFVLLVFMFFLFSYNSMSDSSYFCLMIFLGFMVMDSVLGLCCLLLGSRNSSSSLSPFSSL